MAPMQKRVQNLFFVAVFALVIIIVLNHTSLTDYRTNQVIFPPPKNGFLWRKGEVGSKVNEPPPTNNTTSRPAALGWILHFNYKPHPEALKTLLYYYAKHFVSIVIVCPTGITEKLMNVSTSDSDAQLFWAPPCDNYLHSYVAGRMMRCYATGLEILQANTKFRRVDYVVLSNDDVILNMTKVREFALEGRPVSHGKWEETHPPIFEPPSPNVTYFKGWVYGDTWPECQQVFLKVPQKYNDNFLNNKFQGNKALTGGADVFFLPSDVVSEFIFLSTIVSDCWLEIGIPNVLAMLSNPVKFYSPPSEVFMYRWWGVVITPEVFEQQVGNNSIVSFHPFKLSYPEHRSALANFMTKYKFNE